MNITYNLMNYQKAAQNIAFNQLIEIEILRTSRQLRSMRVASKDHARLIRAWSEPAVLREIVNAGLRDWFRRITDKAKKFVSEKVLNLWKRVRGKLEKFKQVFKHPKALKALSRTVGEITPSNIKKMLKKGKRAIEKVFKNIKAILMTKTDAPTLTDLIKRTAIGAGIADWFDDNVKPKADVIDEFLKKHIPNLRRVLVAAIFIFIWINVDELSWEWADIVQGFTGAISLPDLLATLPESTIGFLSSIAFGIGYTIMPYMIAGRLLWLVSNKYLTWRGNEYKVNWSKVDKERFREADQMPIYRELTVMR